MGGLRPAQAAVQAHADVIAAIQAAPPDSVDLLSDDDAAAAWQCACAPLVRDDGDPCQWTHPGGPGADDVTDDAPTGVTLAAGSWSGSCVPKSCVEFAELTSLNGTNYSMPPKCGGRGAPDGGTP